jgi:hypothetical protein
MDKGESGDEGPVDFKVLTAAHDRPYLKFDDAGLRDGSTRHDRQ